MGPDLSSGNIPLPNWYAMRTPADDVSRSRIQSWNVAVERRLAYDISAGRRVCWDPPENGFADLNVNASTTPGCGADCQPFYRGSAAPSRDLWGPGRRRTTTLCRSPSTGRSRTGCC